MKYLYIFFWGVLFFVGCTQEDQKEELQTESHTLKNSVTLDPVGIDMFKSYEGFILGNDHYTSRIIKYDETDFEKINAYGAEGDGPGEFRRAGYFDIHSDSIYALRGQSHIHIFHLKDGYNRTINLPDGILGGALRFSIQDSGILLFRRYHKKPIVKIDFHGNIVKEYGNWYGDFDDPYEKFVNNVSHLIYSSPYNKVLRIFKGYPYLEVYSKEGLLRYQKDFSDDHFIRDRYQFIENEHEADPENYRNTYHLFEDADIYEDRLAILVYRKGIGARDILLFEIMPDDLVLKGRYQFEEEPFENLRTIALKDRDTLIGFEHEEQDKFHILSLD